MIEVGSVVRSVNNSNTIYRVLSISNNSANVKCLESGFKYSNVKLDMLCIYELNVNMKVIDGWDNSYIVERVESDAIFSKDNVCISISYIDWYKTFKANESNNFKIEPIESDEIIQNSSLEKYAEVLAKSVAINPLRVDVEVKFAMDDLIEDINRKRDKLVKLKELLEDGDIKELLDIEVIVR